jgi:DNA-binding LytR/AlgR family response regulator
MPAISILPDDRIAIRRGSSVEVFLSTDVVSVHSKRNMTRLVLCGGEVSVYVPFRDAVSLLSRAHVLRIHRGVAVNAARVRRIVGRGQHRLSIVLDTGCKLAVGRAYQPAIRRQFTAANRTVSARVPANQSAQPG